ncbi:hypothetical protein AGR4B_pAt10130 [Agrobacterium tumefaciens str. CFBP 5621]|nr:hypothetical protein AGR4B_pAt10130 [Agrobacterium tumefaciens str. CFBP 5621]
MVDNVKAMHHFRTEQLAPVTNVDAWVCYEMAAIIPLCAWPGLCGGGHRGGRQRRR